MLLIVTICPRVPPLIWSHKSWQNSHHAGFSLSLWPSFQQRIRTPVLPFEVLHTWKHVGEEFAATAPGEIRIPFCVFCVFTVSGTWLILWRLHGPLESYNCPLEQGGEVCAGTQCCSCEHSCWLAHPLQGLGFVLIPCVVLLSSAHHTFSQPPHINLCLGSGARISLSHQSVDSYPFP